MPKHLIGWAVAAALAMVLGAAGNAGAAEVKVLSDAALEPVLKELALAFEKASGNKLVVKYDAADKVSDQVAADADIDVAIMPKPLADKLVAKAKLVGGTSAALAKSKDLTFIAASPMVSEQPLPAKALIDFLSKPEAQAVFKAKGMEPG